MDDTFLVILMLAAVGGVGYLIWKQNQTGTPQTPNPPVVGVASAYTNVVTPYGTIQACPGQPVTTTLPPNCANPITKTCWNPTTNTVWYGPSVNPPGLQISSSGAVTRTASQNVAAYDSKKNALQWLTDMNGCMTTAL